MGNLKIVKTLVDALKRQNEVKAAALKAGQAVAESKR